MLFSIHLSAVLHGQKVSDDVFSFIVCQSMSDSLEEENNVSLPRKSCSENRVVDHVHDLRFTAL